VYDVHNLPHITSIQLQVYIVLTVASEWTRPSYTWHDPVTCGIVHNGD